MYRYMTTGSFDSYFYCHIFILTKIITTHRFASVHSYILHTTISFPIMSTTAPPPLPQLTITYFEFGGRVEPSRLTCVIGGIPFTNEVVPIAEFAERKKDLPMHQLPLLYVDQEETDRAIVGQSDAILRYVGKLAGECSVYVCVRWSLSDLESSPWNRWLMSMFIQFIHLCRSISH